MAEEETPQVIPHFAVDDVHVDDVHDNPAYVDDESVDKIPLDVGHMDSPQYPMSFSEDSEEYKSTSELSDWSCVYYGARLLVCGVFFMIVFASIILFNVCLFSLTSDLHVSEDMDVVFRIGSVTSTHSQAQAGKVTRRTEEHLSTDVMTIWGLLTILCAPYVFTALSCLWKVITMQTEKLKWKVIIKAALPDTIHTVGLIIFLFHVLPSFDPFTGYLLSVSVASCPGLLMIFDNAQKESRNRSLKVILLTFFLILCLACSGLFCYRVVLVRQFFSLKILLPISLVFVSFSWWDNYVIRRKGAKYRNALENLKTAVGLNRPKVYLIMSIWKILSSFALAFGTVSGGNLNCLRTVMTLDEKAYGCMLDANVTLTNNGYEKWILVCICLCSSAICYKTVKYACKIQAQIPCATVPLFLSYFAFSVLILWALLTAKDINTWVGIQLVPDYSLTDIHPLTLLSSYFNVYWFPLMLGTFIYLFAVPGAHMFNPQNEKFARTQSLFRQPLYCSILLLPSLILNRNREEGTQKKVPDKNSARAMIHLCATMWHEEPKEMLQLIKSIFRLDTDEQSTTSRFFNINTFEFDAHIFFDDAFLENKKVNDYVKRLVDVIRSAARMEFKMDKMMPSKKYRTRYGGRLEWKLPNDHTLYVHLKDSKKIRAKKRWSQVMYMYYLIKYKILAKFDGEKGRQKAANTFILTLDGDVDFQPHSVHTLLDRIKANPEIGSLCGRIHPVGSGPMLWYQKFEYAVSHWLQKAAENMFGCVLCSPGCFSIFRASALNDVMAKYTTPVTSAFQKVQYDLGEDRWLCTLLLQKGYRVEYTAAADSYTFAPEGFVEFFKQRRRWTPSTMANTYDLVRSWRETTDNNPNISLLFIIYQLGLLVASVVTPGTIFMLMVGALSSAFPALPLFASFLLNLVPIFLFVILNLKSSQNVQAYYGQILTICYCLLMTVVLVGIIKQSAEGGFCSASTLFLTVVASVFVTAAMLHPQEGLLLLYGPLYFLMIPCTSLLMFVYSVANINDTSWGTRDTNIDETTPKPELLKLPRQIRPCLRCLVPSEEPKRPQEKSAPPVEQGTHREFEPYEGESEILSNEEDAFWKQLLDDHLKPEDSTYNINEMKRDLTTIRNNAFLGFILINAIFIILIFSLESIAEQTSNLSFEIPCPYANFKPERILPIAMAFTMVFGVFLLLQWFGMIAHRFSTLLQVVASSQALRKRADPVSENDVFRLENAYRKVKAERQYLDVNIEDERQGDRKRRENRRKREQGVELEYLWRYILNVAVVCYRDNDNDTRTQRQINTDIMKEIQKQKTLNDLPKKIIIKLINNAYTDIKELDYEQLDHFAQVIKQSEDKQDKREHIQKTVRKLMGARPDVRSIFDQNTENEETHI